MEFDNRLFILMGIAAIFAGARTLYDGMRAIRKRYFKFGLGRSINDQVFRGAKARRVGIPVSILGAVLLISGLIMIRAYESFTLAALGMVIGLAGVSIAWAVLEMGRMSH